MLPVLSAQAMREADRYTIDTVGIPGFTLMETAGRTAVDAMMRRLDPAAFEHVVCICGKGNNGGDGFVVARILHALGVRVTVVMLHPMEALTPDSRRHAEIAHTLQDEQLECVDWASIHTLSSLEYPTCWVDAMLGIGVEGALRTPYREIVTFLNAHPAPVVALDIPTGLHADAPDANDEALHATLTVAMGALKPALLLSESAGEVEVVEIGIPAAVMDERATESGCAWMAEDEDIADWLPGRDRSSHKYTAGLVLAIAGSSGLTGAAAMAARSAARAGAGAVVCATPASAEPVLATKVTTVMTLALPEGDEGVDDQKAGATLEPVLAKANALLVGCGLGRHNSTDRFIRDILQKTHLPVVLDADGLRAFAGRTDLITNHADGRWVLTPHMGEFKALAGSDVDVRNRVEAVRRHARMWNAVVLLKGFPSIVGAPDGRVFINPTGNPAMATAGTGDVLAGLCAGFLAQGLPPLEAATAALHVGGAVADAYIKDRSMRAMVATDLIEDLPKVLKQRYQS